MTEEESQSLAKKLAQLSENVVELATRCDALDVLVANLGAQCGFDLRALEASLRTARAAEQTQPAEIEKRNPPTAALTDNRSGAFQVDEEFLRKMDALKPPPKPVNPMWTKAKPFAEPAEGPEA